MLIDGYQSLFNSFLPFSSVIFQGAYNPYAAQQYLQVYGMPGVTSMGPYSYGQLGHPSSGSHGYTSLQNYAVPGQHLVQFSGPSLNGATTSLAMPTIQAPYPTGKKESSFISVDFVQFF